MFDTPIILYGPDYKATYEKAKSLANELLNQCEGHPDFFEIKPEGKNYSKEQIVDFLKDISLSPYQAKHKVYLFHQADKMLPVHSNALLKTFEEKPSFAVILLLTEDIKAILETIISRSKKMFVPKLYEVESSDVKKVVLDAITFIKNHDYCSCIDLLPKLEEFDLEQITDEVLNSYQTLNLSLEKIEQVIERAFLANERHMKLKLILEYIFLQPI